MSVKAGLKLVRGVGYNDGKYKTYDVSSGKHTKEYHLWKGILTRCYIKTKFYEDSIVSENFRNYSYFYEWCNRQIGFDQDGFELDKDLLFKGNVVYSEDVCVFLPKEVNNVLTNRKRHRGQYPVGVSYHKVSGKFSATCSIGGKSHHLVVYLTVEEAFNVYKETKELYVKELAIKWKDSIDERAYLALISFTVNIND